MPDAPGPSSRARKPILRRLPIVLAPAAIIFATAALLLPDDEPPIAAAPPRRDCIAVKSDKDEEPWVDGTLADGVTIPPRLTAACGPDLATFLLSELITSQQAVSDRKPAYPEEYLLRRVWRSGDEMLVQASEGPPLWVSWHREIRSADGKPGIDDKLAITGIASFGFF